MPAMLDKHHDWTTDEILALFALPFNDLLYRAHSIHRKSFPANEIQISTLLSIKTGGCQEDCKYCPQSARYHTGVKADKLMDTSAILEKAQQAKENGASRFCMGAAWRNPKDKDIPQLTEIIKGVKTLGLETCMTLGMLTREQARNLGEAGLDYYNHNIDTSEAYYKEIITTRAFSDRLETLENVRHAGMKVCCGGIIGMGESVEDRADMLRTLANMAEHPESVPINRLIPTPGTPLENEKTPDNLDFIRTIAVARIVMPASVVRLSAGREDMSDEMQALCFFAGANSIFYGEKLLTASNPSEDHDKQLFKRLGLKPTEPTSDISDFYQSVA